MEFHAWIKQRVLKTLAWFWRRETCCEIFAKKKGKSRSQTWRVWRSHKQSLLVPLCAGTGPAKRARIPGNGGERGPRVFYTFLGCECLLVWVHVRVFAPTHVEPSVFMFSELTDGLLFRLIPKSDLRGEESTDMNPRGDRWSSFSDCQRRIVQIFHIHTNLNFTYTWAAGSSNQSSTNRAELKFSKSLNSDLNSMLFSSFNLLLQNRL